jgi:hypothetical protein
LPVKWQGFFVFRSINNLMIQICPNCGHTLQNELKDGLAHCLHCNQIFDSSDFNRLLSAAWQIRKEHLSLEEIKWKFKLGNDFSILMHTFVIEYCYSHDELIVLFKKLGVANKSYLDFSK